MGVEKEEIETLMTRIQQMSTDKTCPLLPKNLQLLKPLHRHVDVRRNLQNFKLLLLDMSTV
jgi:hypothetical protein